MSWRGWRASSSGSLPAAGWPACRCGWLARPMFGHHVHMAARSLVPAGPYEPPRLSSAALVATYVHDHAAGAEVFAGPPKIAVGNARDRLAYHARDRALPQPACDIIAYIWRELARQVFGPAAQVVPDAVTKLGRVWSAAAWCHTATLTLLAGLGIRSRARDLAGPAGGPVRDLRGQMARRGQPPLGQAAAVAKSAGPSLPQVCESHSNPQIREGARDAMLLKSRQPEAGTMPPLVRPPHFWTGLQLSLRDVYYTHPDPAAREAARKALEADGIVIWMLTTRYGMDRRYARLTLKSGTPTSGTRQPRAPSTPGTRRTTVKLSGAASASSTRRNHTPIPRGFPGLTSPSSASVTTRRSTARSGTRSPAGRPGGVPSASGHRRASSVQRRLCRAWPAVPVPSSALAPGWPPGRC